jgi:dTDP-4-amino-4,6-dideoxygalactose transaminase
VQRRRLLGARIEAALPHARFQRTPTGGVANRQTLGVMVSRARRDALIVQLQEAGVQVGPLSYALHRLPQLAAAAAGAARRGEALSHACAIAEGGLALPLYPGMDDATCAALIEKLAQALARAED